MTAQGKPVSVQEARALLAELAECAEGWDPKARLVGNLRAGDIAAAVRETLREASEPPTLQAARKAYADAQAATVAAQHARDTAPDADFGTRCAAVHRATCVEAIALDTLIAAARREALEEAAKVADAHASENDGQDEHAAGWRDSGSQMAVSIRALASQVKP